MAIAKAESGFKNICNKEFGCISGIGPFQFIRSTFNNNCEGDIFESKDNIKCGIKLLKNQEYSHWYYYSGKIWFPTLSNESKKEVLNNL